MIDVHEARRRAAEEVGEGRYTPEEGTPMILDDKTLEIPEGWVFFYNSREYIETGDFSFCLAGNAPVVVTRDEGRVHATGTAEPLETYLNRLFPGTPRPSSSPRVNVAVIDGMGPNHPGCPSPVKK